MDLADARAAWAGETALSDEEREARQRSYFFAAVNHGGEVAVFYFTRHGHGTALAEAGVPEKDIAASMHHASRTTTAPSLHSDRKAARAAIDAMPDLAYPAAQAATGTNGAEPAKGLETPERLTGACSSRKDSAGFGGTEDDGGRSDEHAKKPKNAGERGKAAETADGPLGGIGRRDGFKIHFP